MMSNAISRIRSALALITVVAVVQGCLFDDDPNRPADRDTEGVDARLRFGVTVTERVAYLADRDEYNFELAAGQEAIVFLQKTEQSYARIRASVILGTGQGTRQVNVSAWQPGDDLESTPGGRVSAETDAKFTVAVSGDLGPNGNETSGGGYRLQVRLSDPRPEQASVALPVGTTTLEPIDHYGDRDQFVLSGVPGDEYVLFLTGVAPLEAFVLPGLPGARILTPQPNADLLRNQSGRFVMPATGSAAVHITGVYSRDARFRAPYQLFAHRVVRAPEDRPAEITLTTGPIIESIAVPGDVDEFLLTTTEPATVDVILTRLPENAIGGTVWVRLLPAVGVHIIKSTGTQPRQVDGVQVDMGSTGPFPLAPGSYRLVVEGTTSDATSFQGKYQLELRLVNPTP